MLSLAALVGCQESISFPSITDRYHLEVVTTRPAYAAGDSVFVRITNGENALFFWHRCPGILLERKSGTTWTALDDGGACTQANFGIPGGETLTVVFVMPLTAFVGQYRVSARLSAIDAGTPQFWYPSPEFSVTGG